MKTAFDIAAKAGIGFAKHVFFMYIIGKILKALAIIALIIVAYLAVRHGFYKISSAVRRHRLDYHPIDWDRRKRG